MRHKETGPISLSEMGPVLFHWGIVFRLREVAWRRIQAIPSRFTRLGEVD
jgi:hypothetical protein